MLTERVLVAAAEHFPALTRGAAKLAEDALGSTRLTKAFGFNKSAGELLKDLGDKFPDLKVHYPDAHTFEHAPVGDLKSDFLKQRNAIQKTLQPAEAHLPHLGFHGTSQPFGNKILGSQSFKAIDFATQSPEHLPTTAASFISSTGKGMETAVSFSNKWKAVDGSPAGPVFVLDVGKADKIMGFRGDVRHPYASGDVSTMADLMPGAQQFKGTLYNIHEGNFSSVVIGHIDQSQLQSERALASHINDAARAKIAGGANTDSVYKDTAQRGQILDATRRLELSHHAISKWLQSAY